MWKRVGGGLEQDGSESFRRRSKGLDLNLVRGLRPDHCFCARRNGRLGGIKKANTSVGEAGAGDASDLRRRRQLKLGAVLLRERDEAQA